MGKVIGAKYIVLGTVSRFGNTFSLDARLVDVESSESIRSGDYTTSKAIDNLLLQGVKSVVMQLVGDDSENTFTQDSEDFSAKPKIWNTEDYISYFRIGFDLEGSFSDYEQIDGASGTNSYYGKPGTGLTLGYEYARPNGFGFGIDFQFLRSSNKEIGQGWGVGGDFRYSSLYAVWNSTFSNGFSLFSKGGYTFLSSDKSLHSDFYDFENGYFFSLGFRRVISDAMHLECGFSANSIDQVDLQDNITSHLYTRPYIGLSFIF